MMLPLSKLRNSERIYSQKIVCVCLYLVILSSLFVLPMQAQADRCGDPALCDNTCPTLKPRGGCMGPWGGEIKKDKEGSIDKNKEKIINAINDYLRQNYPRSRFLEMNNPGSAFLSAGVDSDVNPFLLLGIANYETAMATAGQSMECGNPWAQKKPTQGKNKGCKSSDGTNWYEYNPQHSFNPIMIGDQTGRIRRKYINDPEIRTFDDFIDKYQNENPFRQIFRSGSKEEMKKKIQEPITALNKAVRGALRCGSGNNTKPQSKEEWLDVFREAGEITQVPWEFIAAIAWNETSMGGNLGGCSYHPPPPDSGWVLTSGNGLRLPEDLDAFDRVAGAVDVPDNSPVSCNASVGSGGAMGYTQVMPQEWEGRADMVEAQVGHYPSPWNALDAVMMAGFILKDKGGIAIEAAFPEDINIMRIAAGAYNGSGPYEPYAANVLATYLEIKLTGNLP